MPAAKKHFHLHLISDSTGETLTMIAKAVCALFEEAEPQEHIYGLVRSERQLKRVLDNIARHPGPVLYSLVSAELNQSLERFCRKQTLPYISALEPFINLLGGYLGLGIRAQPGRQHIQDKDYFARVAALNYIMHHDDGQNQDNLAEADVILIGVSRTTKTPTCMYLANRGLKSANIPFVPQSPILAELASLTAPLIVGLTTSPERLVQIRKNRLLAADEQPETGYVNLDEVRRETAAALKLFRRHGWAVIDVSRRSIEETAAEILNLLAAHKERAAKPRLTKEKEAKPRLTKEKEAKPRLTKEKAAKPRPTKEKAAKKNKGARKS